MVMRTSWSGSLRAFVLGTRASTGIELAIGAVVLLGVAAACFDLYSRVEADTTSARLAATMADYVSRGPDPADGKLDGDALKALGKFLHEHELDAPAHLVFVITAFEQQGGNPKFHWLDDTLRFGDTTVTTELAGKCPQYIEENGGEKTAKNLSGFQMAVDEVLIIVEICARLTREGSLTGRFVAGDIYRLHALPLRTPGKSLPEPTYARLDTDVPADVPPTARAQA